MIEYQSYDEANNAREALDGSDILGQAIGVDWCFVKGPKKYVIVLLNLIKFIIDCFPFCYNRNWKRGGRKSRRVYEEASAGPE